MAETATGLSHTDTMSVLATIASFHPAFPVDDTTVVAWAAAFEDAGITSLPDTVRAVVKYYSNPENSDPWIRPWHVVSGVRAIRSERTRGLNNGDLDRDMDPEDPEWVSVVNRRWAAISDGMSVEEAYQQIQPIRMVAE